MRESSNTMAKAAPAMLPTPQQSPEPHSDLVGPAPGRGPPRHSTRTATPGTKNGRQRGSQKDPSQTHHNSNTQIAIRDPGQTDIDENVDNVPISVARAVVNMQEYYAAELEGEKERSESLQKQCDAMQQRMEEMERRIQTQVILMAGFVGFMEQVKKGQFAIGEGARNPEMEIAQRLGGEHLEAVHNLLSLNQQPVLETVYGDEPENEQAVDADDDDDDDDIPETTQLPDDGYPDTDLLETTTLADAENVQPPTPSIVISRDDVDLPLPTPDLYTSPLRSTGIKAIKRKFPPSRTQRKIKRRVGMSSKDIYEMKLDKTLKDLEYCEAERRLTFRRRGHEGSSVEYSPSPSEAPSGPRMTRMRVRWKAINGQPAEQESLADAISVDGDAGSNYEPTPTKTSRAVTKGPQVATQRAPATLQQPAGKPRYAKPRSTGTHYATGPPGGQPYKFTRMPKRVALVWQEWKHGLHGNPSLEFLEREYSTSWRQGTLHELKYGSNYVGKRLKIVKKVEQMCEEDGLTPEEACTLLDRRIDGRLELLMKVLRDGKDPFTAIPLR
ncbi:hypothetical protein AUP68_05672 [Ilyonectria robusta]